MKTRARLILLIIALSLPFSTLAFSDAEPWDMLSSLIRKIPHRSAQSPTGSQFAERISGLDSSLREEAIEKQLDSGNLPDSLRRLKPVKFRQEVAGRIVELTIFVMPDYLAVGSNDDFLLIPMSLRTALRVAERFGFILPTKKIVNAIFGQSAYHLTPQPLPAGPRMRSTAYYEMHNQKIARQRLALCCTPGELISGHKKDVVVTNHLNHREGKIAIYGWHRPSGDPIQPLSTIHGASYADYSHGIRLISDVVLLNGQPRSIYEVLEDPQLAPLLSDEGPLKMIRGLMARH